MKKNKDKIIAIIYIAMMCLMFFNKSKIIVLNNMQKNIIEIVLLLMTSTLVFMERKNLKEIFNIEKTDKKIVVTIGILFLTMMIYSMIVILINGTRIDELIVDTLITIGMFLVSLILAYNSNKVFKENTLKYILYAGIINYVLVIIFFICQNGIVGLFNFKYLNREFIDTSLEVHELTFIFGLIFTYFIISSKKHKISEYVLLVVFLYLGYKRILTGGIILVLILFLIEKIYIVDKEKMLKIVNITTISVVIIYLLMSSVGLKAFENLSNTIGLNLMGRNELYDAFQDKYSVSPFYFGRGIRSTDMIIRSTPEIYGYTALHNDILRIYIENGFYMFLAYFIIHIFIVSKMLKEKGNIKIALQYSYLFLYTVVCYTTDNIFTYYRYLFVFWALVLFMINNTSIEDEIDVKSELKRFAKKIYNMGLRLCRNSKTAKKENESEKND